MRETVRPGCPVGQHRPRPYRVRRAEPNDLRAATQARLLLFRVRVIPGHDPQWVSVPATPGSAPVSPFQANPTYRAFHPRHPRFDRPAPGVSPPAMRVCQRAALQSSSSSRRPLKFRCRPTHAFCCDTGADLVIRFTLLSLIPYRSATSLSFTPVRRASAISCATASPRRSATRLGVATVAPALTLSCGS
jgi:hypothetical protein